MTVLSWNSHLQCCQDSQTYSAEHPVSDALSRYYERVQMYKKCISISPSNSIHHPPPTQYTIPLQFNTTPPPFIEAAVHKPLHHNQCSEGELSSSKGPFLPTSPRPHIYTCASMCACTHREYVQACVHMCTHSEPSAWASIILKLIGCFLASSTARSREMTLDSITEGTVFVSRPRISRNSLRN